MGQVTVTLNGRAYRLGCGDGEEERLIALADHVRSKLDTLVAQFGQAGNDRLLLMAALLIADELWDARATAMKPDGKPHKVAS
jgi:cell division protein ZapA